MYTPHKRTHHFNGHLPGKPPELASCPFGSHSTAVPNLSISQHKPNCSYAP